MDNLGIQAYFVCVCSLIAILSKVTSYKLQVIFKWGQVKTEIYWPTGPMAFNCYSCLGVDILECRCFSPSSGSF